MKRTMVSSVLGVAALFGAQIAAAPASYAYCTPAGCHRSVVNTGDYVVGGGDSSLCLVIREYHRVCPPVPRPVVQTRHRYWMSWR